MKKNVTSSQNHFKIRALFSLFFRLTSSFLWPYFLLLLMEERLPRFVICVELSLYVPFSQLFYFFTFFCGTLQCFPFFFTVFLYLPFTVIVCNLPVSPCFICILDDCRSLLRICWILPSSLFPFCLTFFIYKKKFFPFVPTFFFSAVCS